MNRMPVIKVARILLGAALLALARNANADTITVDLPELLGSYVYSDLTTFGVTAIGARKSVAVPLGANTLEATNARVVICGYVSPGLVRGDGVLRSAQEAALRGGFTVGFSYNASGMFYQNAELQHAVDGAFGRERQVAGPFGPMLWIDLDLLPEDWSGSLPGIIGAVPEGGILWSEGLQLLSPLTGNITDAYLVLEGPPVPEPATLSLLALGGLMALGRRPRS